MIRVALSPTTLHAFDAAIGQAISTVEVPHGYWHEFQQEPRGYEPGTIRIVLQSAATLEVWAEMLRPISHPWCEVFVIEAAYGRLMAPPPLRSNSGRKVLH